MRILITGNIASGKSTLIEALIRRLSEEAHINMAHIGIDTMRELYSNGTAEGETLARKRFKRAVYGLPDSFIECCPYSLAYNTIIDKVDYIVLVTCDTATCIERYHSRPYSVPLAMETPVECSVVAVNAKIKRLAYNMCYHGDNIGAIYNSLLSEIRATSSTE